MRITGKESEQAGGCNEADSLKSGKQLHNTQIPAKGNETDSTVSQELKKSTRGGRKATMFQEIENKKLYPWVATWG